MLGRGARLNLNRHHFFLVQVLLFHLHKDEQVHAMLPALEASYREVLCSQTVERVVWKKCHWQRGKHNPHVCREKSRTLWLLWAEIGKDACLLLVNCIKILYFVKLSEGGVWANCFIFLSNKKDDWILHSFCISNTSQSKRAISCCWWFSPVWRMQETFQECCWSSRRSVKSDHSFFKGQVDCWHISVY